MLITRRSMVTGVWNTLELDISKEQIDLYHRGATIQVAFPNLSADDREFFKTGITPEEWSATFPEEEENE